MLDTLLPPTYPSTCAPPRLHADRLPYYAFPIVFAARLIAATIARAIWCSVILLVWATRLVVASASISVSAVVVAFGGGTPAARLDQLHELALLWPRGFVTLFMLPFRFQAVTTPHPPIDRYVARLVADTLVSFWLLSMLVLVVHVAPPIADRLHAIVLFSSAVVGAVVAPVGTALLSVLPCLATFLGVG